MTFFFTADLHYNSKNAILRMNRPFSNVDEMNTALLNNWNNLVTNQDTIFILGDFVWGKDKSIISQLNGNKHLILGNHDTEKDYLKLKEAGILQDVKHVKGVTIDGSYIWMSHYSHQSWKNSFHGSYHLFGHSHGTLEGVGKSIDVGVDCWNYSPVSWEHVKTVIDNKVLEIGR